MTRRGRPYDPPCECGCVRSVHERITNRNGRTVPGGCPDHPDHLFALRRKRTDEEIRADPNLHGYYGGRRKDGGPCGALIVAGTTTCARHAGVPQFKVVAEGEIRLEIRKWMVDGHDGTNLDLPALLLQLVAYWRWKLNEYGRLLGEAYEAAERLRQAHQAGELLTTEATVERDDEGNITFESPAIQAARADLDRIFTTGGVAALIGYKYDADRHGRVFPVQESVRGLQRLHDEASDRYAKYIGLAMDKGVAERAIRLAESQGALMTVFVTRVFDRLGMTDEQRRLFPAVLEAEVINITGGDVAA
jgi:hypothetical protein